MKFIVLVFFILSESFKVNTDEIVGGVLPETSTADLLSMVYTPKVLDTYIRNILKDVHNPGENQRIYDGKEMPRHVFPFQIGLVLSLPYGRKTWCGGTIISNQFILTAAHCLKDASNATVIMGAHDRLNSNEPGRQTQIVKRKNFIIHKFWDDDDGKNDIALIKLNQLIKFTNQIQPILVANTTYASIDGVPAAASGWGYFNRSNLLSPYLQYTGSRIISNALCRETYGKYVRSTNICLDGRQGRACTGDSGGPLVIRTHLNKLVQVGITSFGWSQGCEQHYPTVFTRVSKYYEWLRRYVKI